jgi:pimeloyl-ACP methyl ester carboxylesterase
MSAGCARTRWVENRGLNLAVHGWGAERPLALAIHGFMDHGLSFRWVAEHLQPDGLAAADMRGFGRSDWVGDGGYYHFYDYYDDVGRILDALEGPVGLVGHSMGGSIASAVAALFPERVRWLLLLEGMGPPPSPLDESAARLGQWLRAVRRRQGPAAARRRMRRSFPSLEDGAYRLRSFNRLLTESRSLALAESFSEVTPEGRTWRVDPLHRTPSAKPFLLEEARSLWLALQVPVISLWGDQGFRPDDLPARHGCIPRLLAGVVPDASHNVHHDRPDVVADAVHRLEAGRFELPAQASPL